MFGRRRFGELVERQLELFAIDEASLLAEAGAADTAWTHADRGRSEKLFGDYQLVADAVAERLLDVREAYASTLEEDVAAEYGAAFDRAARKRFRSFTGLLDG